MACHIRPIDDCDKDGLRKAGNVTQSRFPRQNSGFPGDPGERAVIIHLLFKAPTPTVVELSFKGHHKCGPML